METIIDSFGGEHAFLSNFHYCPVELDGVTYPTVENAYQAAKTQDPVKRQAFVNITPSEAKHLGRSLDISPNWDLVKRSIMQKLLEQKFNVEKYKKKLLDTGNAKLVEGNWWHDNYWGICSCDKCTVAYANKKDKNQLGQLLMEIRKSLQPRICHTGGARGADMLFETECLKYNIDVIAYSFEGHSTKSTCRKILTSQELEDVNNEVSQVGALISRTPPFKRPEIIKYIQRDIYQSMYSDIVYGIATLNKVSMMPDGGTAWAVGYGVLRNIPVFFFDQVENAWFKYENWVKGQWDKIGVIPDEYFKYKSFTGIGTRTLQDNGIFAIEHLIKTYIIRS